MEKFATKRMNSETVGIARALVGGLRHRRRPLGHAPDQPGEFIHAAPWSVGSQGVANVSTAAPA